MAATRAAWASSTAPGWTTSAAPPTACPSPCSRRRRPRLRRSRSKHDHLLRGRGDDEAALIVGARVGGDDEEARPVRLVALGGAHEHLAVLELHADLAARGGLGRVELVDLLVAGVPEEVLHEEDGLELAHDHLHGLGR